MRFEHPHLLWLLLVIPPGLGVFFWWGERVKQKLLTQFVEPRLLTQLTAGLSPQRRKWKYILLVTAAALLIVAIALPQRGFFRRGFCAISNPGRSGDRTMWEPS